MKTKLILTIFMLIVVSSNAQHWQEQFRHEEANSFNRIFFLDENNGWTIKFDSPYFYTSNGGEDWLPSDSPEMTGYDIVFINADTGFIGSNNGIIYRTLDGGINWSTVQTPDTNSWFVNRIMYLNFSSAIKGWAASTNYQGHILHTINAGESWEAIDVLPSDTGAIQNVFFISDSIGYVIAHFMEGTPPSTFIYMILKTDDEGNNWDTLFYSSTPYTETLYLQDVFFYNEQSGWAVCGQHIEGVSNTLPLILHTDDGGITWEEQEIDLEGPVFCVTFISESTGWVGTDDGVYTTINGGEQWEQQELVWNNYFWNPEINDIHMVNQDTGWAVGSDFIYKTVTGGWVNTNEIDYDKHFFTIDPNPASDHLLIKFSETINEASGSLNLVDLMGKSLYNRNITVSENHEEYINLTNYPPGVYFLSCTIYVNKTVQREVKKVIKL